MSLEDPSDDELEREAKTDNPLAAGGSPKHAPRLGTVSRAINPRELLQAEERGMRGEFRMPTAREASETQRPRMISQAHVEQRPRSLLSRTQPQQPTATPENVNARAWDAYAAAAMQVIFPLYEGAPPEDIANTAALLADLLLGERKQRFG